MVELVFTDFAAEGVAMDAEHFCGAALIAFGAIQDAFDETLFKFADGFIEENSPVHHLCYEPFQLSFTMYAPRGKNFS